MSLLHILARKSPVCRTVHVLVCMTIYILVLKGDPQNTAYTISSSTSLVIILLVFTSHFPSNTRVLGFQNERPRYVDPKILQYYNLYSGDLT